MGLLKRELERTERHVIKRVLRAERNDPKRASKKLGITQPDLRARARRLKIALPPPNPPRPKRAAPKLADAIGALERQYITAALKDAAGAVRTAAKLLQVPPTRIYRRLDELGIERPAGRPAKRPRRRNLPAAIARLERRRLREALVRTGGDITAAARLLGVSRSTIYRMQV